MKKHKTKLYAKALAEVLAKKGINENNVVSNFVKLLVDSGLEKKSKEILNLTENFVLAKQGKRKITFETARKITNSQQKMLNDFVEKGDVVKEKINPEIISGVKIIINNEKQFDASMQSKLQNIL
jgi:F0F1-type ATP synthase delta subunit